MNRWMLAVLALILLIMPTINVAAGEYALRQGDVLGINVFGYPEISYPAPGNPESIIIRSDGCFAFPLVGEIKAEGLSPQALAKMINELLGQYYVNPKVTVNVLRFSTERVYVMGEVNAPGLYELDKSRNLMDAIGAAKGWTKDAAKTKVFVIHKDHKGDAIRVNLLELLKKADVSKNVSLHEGDIVFLTKNNRIDIVNDILPLTQLYYNLKTSAVFGGNNNQ